MKPNKKVFHWVGIALLMLCSLTATAQQVKNAGIRYFAGVPTGTPSSTAGEVAIDTATGYLYLWQRDAAAWVRTNTVDRLAGTSAPGYVPSDKQSIFVVTDADSLYMYRSGAWRHLNAGGGGVSDGSKGDIVVSSSGTVWDIAADAVTSAEIASGAVGTTEIAAGAVTSSDLATDAVTSGKIAANAVSSAKLQSGAVTMDKINASGAIAGQVIRYSGTAWSPETLPSVSDYAFLTAFGAGVSGSNAYDYSFDSLTAFGVEIAPADGTHYFQISNSGSDVWVNGNTTMTMNGSEIALGATAAAVYVRPYEVVNSARRVSLQFDTLQLNDLKYIFPTAHAAGFMYNNGTGTLSFASALTSEVDGSLTNEGALSVGAATDSTSQIATNTAGDGGVYLKEGDGVVITEQSDTITISVPEYTRRYFVQALHSNTTLAQYGIGVTATGTASAIGVAATDVQTRRIRVRYTTTAATNQAAGVHDATILKYSVEGGFYYNSVFFFSTTSANARGVFGFTNTFSSLANNPRSMSPNGAFFGFNDTDTNWYFIWNNGSGVSNFINLGIPKSTASAVWRTEVWGDATYVSYRLTNLATGSAVSGRVTADIPLDATLIGPICQYGTGNAATAVAIDVSSMELRTNY